MMVQTEPVNVASISRLREKHKNGELQLGDIVTLEGLTVVNISKDPYRLVVRDFRKFELMCFVEQKERLDGIGYLSEVNVTGTYHPSSSVINDEFFKIYIIERCG